MSSVYRVLHKIKQKQKNAGMYFTYDVIFTLKDFNIIRENSCKIGNMSENVIKFYRYVKYFSDRFLEHITLMLILVWQPVYLFTISSYMSICSFVCKNNSFIYLIDEKFNHELSIKQIFFFISIIHEIIYLLYKNNY